MKRLLITILLFGAISLSACSNDSVLEGGFSGNISSPTIRVYNTVSQTTTEMDLENYVAGVVAGEVYNTWEVEALKAQAIIARTFALKYAEENADLYKKQGISTNIEDAQNYDTSTINERVLQAVNETKGIVLTHNGNLINAYFHSNSGGKTSLADVGFGSIDSDLPYIKAVSSPENKNNSKNYQWTCSFSKGEVLSALNKLGISLSSLSSAKLGVYDESGRYLTLYLGGKEVSAVSLRTMLGSTKMKSTKLTSIKVENGNLKMSGLGYGHGVGLSQWGAQILATQGKNYKDIINYYFDNVSFTTVK
ncbi:MAG: SpoIID/LytB domain-containing protein [Clostridia bacterium]|nr:SpoIID/LytB domain-containing protein [Clostridia bacterium]